MKLYIFSPPGPGRMSFIVTAESVENAASRINEHIATGKDLYIGGKEEWHAGEYSDPEIYEIGQVALHSND